MTIKFLPPRTARLLALVSILLAASGCASSAQNDGGSAAPTHLTTTNTHHHRAVVHHKRPARHKHRRHHHKVIVVNHHLGVPMVDVPNLVLTPGAVLTTSAARVRVSGYSTSVRDVPDSEKEAVYARYGVPHVGLPA